jgi:putative zinc finger/helix-turn-helix YgiT family protein
MRRYGDNLKPKVFECPNCGSMRIDTRIIKDKFQYGSGAKAVELEALVPFRKCPDCGFEFTDSEAEDLRHEAVCRHLGVMTPTEIFALRKNYGLTRAEFAERSRIGEASLARWETGELIPNPANDCYLYLLSFPENLERLENRYRVQPVRNALRKAARQLGSRFKALDEATTTEKCQEARDFCLRPALG